MAQPTGEKLVTKIQFLNVSLLKSLNHREMKQQEGPRFTEPLCQGEL